jgi:hypothetical protein
MSDVDEITGILNQTFISDALDANECIQEAESFIASHLLSPDFCVSLFAISCSAALSKEIRIAAVLVIRSMILNHWSVDVPPSVKSIIIEQVPVLFNCDFPAMPVLLQMSRILVNCAFFGLELPLSAVLVGSEFNQASLILGCGVAHHFKRCFSDEGIELFEPLVPNFLRTLGASPYWASVAYKIGFYLIHNKAVEFMNSVLNVWLQAATHHDSHYFLSKSMRFCAEAIRRQ